ncbi:hypothetical protein FGO68_gene13261 [Halteria grandinella]|uniref:Vesicle transport protein n=1 Tax=Halteria grandinella TaxID=5974 RepID=A0A8J8NJA0_HALGN|nr:hypothetical protein FGO68_gene13261 [Halteria grandinella]
MESSISQNQSIVGSILGVFSSKKDDRIGKLDHKYDEENSGLIQTAGAKIQRTITEKKELVTQNPLLTERNYKLSLIFLALGALFMFLALTCLPLIILFPGKFSTSFTLGSLFLQLSIAFWRGPLTHFRSLFSNNNLRYAFLLYLASLLFAIYTSVFHTASYVTSLGVLVLQMLSLGYIVRQAWSGEEGTIKGNIEKAVAKEVMSKMVIGSLNGKEEQGKWFGLF